MPASSSRPAWTREVVPALLLAAAACLACPTNASAQAEEAREQPAPRLDLDARLEARDIGYDSNVLRRTDGVGDFTFTGAPQVKAVGRLGRIRFAADSAVDFVYYQRLDTERTVNTRNHVSFSVPFGVATLTTRYGYSNARERDNDDLDAPVRRADQLFTTAIKTTSLTRTTFSLGFRHDATGVPGSLDEGYNSLRVVLTRSSNAVTFGGRFEVTPRTTASLAVVRERSDFEWSPSRDGASWRLEPRLVVSGERPVAAEVMLGYQRFDIADAFVRDYTGPIASLAVRWTALDAMQLSFTGSHDVAYASRIDSPYFVRSTLGVSLTHRVSGLWELGGGLERRWSDYEQRVLLPGDPLETPREVTVSVDGRLLRFVSPRTRVGLAWNFTTRGSELSPDREYDRFRLGATVRYVY